MALSYRSAPLYLDATSGAKVPRDSGEASREMAQEFPISAKRLPVCQLPGHRQIWNSPKLLFFNHL
jgi:hypothetical protein